MHLCFVLFLVCCVSANANFYFKTRFMCPRSIAGVAFDFVRRFRASLLLHTTCMYLCCNWVASCVAVLQTKNQKPMPESREFDFSKLKWRRTKDWFRSGNMILSSTRQAQGLDCYWVGCTVVWLRSSGWSAQSPQPVHGLLESLATSPAGPW